MNVTLVMEPDKQVNVNLRHDFSCLQIKSTKVTYRDGIPEKDKVTGDGYTIEYDLKKNYLDIFYYDRLGKICNQQSILLGLSTPAEYIPSRNYNKKNPIKYMKLVYKSHYNTKLQITFEALPGATFEPEPIISEDKEEPKAWFGKLINLFRFND